MTGSSGGATGPVPTEEEPALPTAEEEAALAEEAVALCHPDGTPAGSAPRSVMRAERRWHLCTAVLVQRGDGRLYVHRRTAGKDVFPSHHDVWAGGVVGAGEPVAAAAARELAEELGITGAALRPLFVHAYDGPETRSVTHAYAVTWDGPVVHQPEEVEAGWWWTVGELDAALAEPSFVFVPDGRELYRRWRTGAPG